MVQDPHVVVTDSKRGGRCSGYTGLLDSPSSSEVLLNGTLEMLEKNKRSFLAVFRSPKSGGLWLGLYGG